MTSIEWLIEKFDKLDTELLINKLENKFSPRFFEFTKNQIIEQAKEIHKQEIINAFKSGLKSPYHQDHTFVTQENQEGTKSGQYYQETFVSKGSDFKQFSLYEHKDTITSADTPVSKTFLESVPKQETLYTEEQVMEVAKYTISEWASLNEQREHDHEKLVKTWLSIELQNFIQSFKQPKQ